MPFPADYDHTQVDNVDWSLYDTPSTYRIEGFKKRYALDCDLCDKKSICPGTNFVAHLRSRHGFCGERPRDLGRTLTQAQCPICGASRDAGRLQLHQISMHTKSDGGASDEHYQEEATADRSDARDAYFERLGVAWYHATEKLQHMVSQCASDKLFVRSVVHAKCCFDVATSIEPTLYQEYLELDRQGWTCPRGAFLVLDHSQVGVVLKSAGHFPILVPSSFVRSTPNKAYQHYVNGVSSMEHIDAYDLAAGAAVGDGEELKGRLLSSQTELLDVIDCRDQKLEVSASASVLGKLPSLRLLGDAGEATSGRTSFKPTYCHLSQEGVFSETMITMNGLYKCCEIKQGEKLWLCWPSGISSKPFPVLTGPGDLFILPPGTPHMSFTIKTCLSVDILFWNMASIMRTVSAARIGNENESSRFVKSDKIIEARYKNY